MSTTTELNPLTFDVTIHSTEQGYVWDRQWRPCMGVSTLDLLADIQDIHFGAGATLSLKPAIQLAATRSDRPDPGNLISGTPVTAAGQTHFQESLSASSKFYFRVGVGYALTAGSFAQVQGTLYTAFNANGRTFPATEIDFNPTNDTTDVSYFPLGGGKPIPVGGVDKARAVIFGMGNANNTMDYRIAGRVFNDPLSRGTWTDLESGWATPSTGDFNRNTGDIDLSGLSPSGKQWLELALAVRKNSGGNARCGFVVVHALSYT